MSFALDVGGYLVLIAGVAWGLAELGVPTTWILIASVLPLEFGVPTGVASTRSRELPRDPPAWWR